MTASRLTRESRGKRSPCEDDGVDYDNRTIALALSRGRIVFGLVLLLVPSIVLRGMLKRSSAETRAIARLLGAREVVLGLGTLTSVKERTQDAEWLSMSAFCDGVDAVVMLAHPGMSKLGRASALIGAGSAVLGMQIARQFATERTEVDALVEELEVDTGEIGDPAPGA